MKVIFLDIDGVLVTFQGLRDRQVQEKVCNAKCIENFNKIIYATDAAIILSSSWRFCGFNEMRLILEYWGVNGDVIGITPDLSEKRDSGLWVAKPRIFEIMKAVEQFNVGSFVILDDEGNSPMDPRHIRTQFNEGLTEEQAMQAIAILNS